MLIEPAQGNEALAGRIKQMTDLTLTSKEYYEEQDLFRQAAIEGLDAGMKDFAIRMFRRVSADKIEGIRDKDLPALFRVTDAAFADAMKRYGVTIKEDA